MQHKYTLLDFFIKENRDVHDSGHKGKCVEKESSSGV